MWDYQQRTLLSSVPFSAIIKQEWHLPTQCLFWEIKGKEQFDNCFGFHDGHSQIGEEYIQAHGVLILLPFAGDWGRSVINIQVFYSDKVESWFSLWEEITAEHRFKPFDSSDYKAIGCILITRLLLKPPSEPWDHMILFISRSSSQFFPCALIISHTWRQVSSPFCLPAQN